MLRVPPQQLATLARLATLFLVLHVQNVQLRPIHQEALVYLAKLVPFQLLDHLLASLVLVVV